MKKYILGLSLLVSLFASAQNTELKDLINRSFTYYPKLKELEQANHINEEKIALVQANNKPTVAGSVSYTYIDPIGQVQMALPGFNKTLQFQPNNNINAGVGVNYVLLDFGRLKAAVEKSKEELNYSKQNLEFSKTQLAAQVSNIYYNIVYLKKAIAIQDSVISFYEQNKKVVESKLRQGDALQIDLLNIQANIDNEQNRKVDLQNNLDKQYNLLAYTTGAQNVQGVVFDFHPLSSASTDSLIQSAQQNNIDFMLTKSKIEQAQRDVEYNKSQYFPTLTLTASAGYKNGIQPDINEFRFNYLAGASLNIPIYTGGKNSSQTQIARGVKQQSELALNTLSKTYEKDIRQALLDVRSNAERLKHAETQVELAKASQQLTASRFKNGVATHLDLTNAATNLQRAELSRLQFEFQQNLSLIELARLTGNKYW